MGDQRPMFRFRLPWMIPSATDQGPEVVTQRPSTQAPTASAETQTPAPAQRQLFRFASVGATQPPSPQAQTTATTQTQAPVTQAPSAAFQSIASTSTMPIPPPMSSTSLGQVSEQEPVTQVGPLSKIEAQPSSPSRAMPQSQAPFQPSSPARVSPQAQAAFEPSSLALSEPPKSPQTVRQPQPLSPFQTTELTSPPSLPATDAQPLEETGTRPASPPKTSDPLKSSQLPTSSSKALSPVFQKEQSLSVPQPLSLEAQPKTASITYGPITTSPVKTITQPSVDVAHPSTQSGHTEVTAPTPVVAKEISPLPTMKSDDYSKPHTNMDGYHVEPKKEKETDHATAKAHEEPKKKIAAEYATVESGLTAHHKAQPKVADQAVEKQDVEKQEMVHAKEVQKIITKQTKSKNSHQKDKSIASGSRHPKVSNGEQVSLQQELRNDIFKLVRKISTAHPEHPMETPISLISLVGENTGASVQLGSEAAERAAVYIHRGHNVNPNESVNATTDKEESSEGRWSKDTNINKDEVTKTYVNNNIQNINNSIVLNASITERNPGIRLAFFHYPAEPIKSNSITESHEIRKAEVSITPPEKLTFSPTILYMGPSDSEPDGLNADTKINVV